MKILAIAVMALFLISVASAGMLIPVADKAKENAKAPENSPVIDDNWNLPDCGKPMCSSEFIHYAGKPAKAPKVPSCYKLLGVKWKTLPVDYVINPTNPQGLEESFITSAIFNGAETWDANTNAELFSNTYLISTGPETTYRVQNYVNAISFGSYSDPNVIAITTIWYAPVGRKIVEFDIMFDTDWTWGDATDSTNPTCNWNTTIGACDNIMDLQNIATHELGHGVGLADVYESACSTVTMYGYSDYGETKKRTLETPDITGLQKLYGV